MLKFALVAAPLVSAAATWTWAKGGDMCAGFSSACVDQESCTSVAYGPCEGTSVAPTQFFHGRVVGIALTTDDSAYLNCADTSNCADMTVVPASGNGYRDYASTAEYAFTMVGSTFGDMAQSGGYIGTASYLAKAEIKTNANNFYTAGATSAEQVKVQRGDSPDGAPQGPYHVCISEITTSGVCGAKKTFNAGDYKFSLFGYTSGASYTPGAANTFLGIRTQLMTEGFTVTDVTLNGNLKLDTVGSTDVKTMTLGIQGGKVIQMAFPLKYNYGVIDQISTTAVDTGLGSKDVKIKVSKASDTSIYIDYLFNLNELNTAGKYFVYDPDVTVEDGASSSTAAPGVSTSAPGVSTSAPGGSTAAPGGSTAAPGVTTAAPGATSTAASSSAVLALTLAVAAALVV